MSRNHILRIKLWYYKHLGYVFWRLYINVKIKINQRRHVNKTLRRQHCFYILKIIDAISLT